MSESRKFERKGALAIHPKALGFDWFFDEKPQAQVKMQGEIAVVEIRGPMIHHDEWWWESYDAIVERARAAFASGGKAVLISGDTPGGEVSGLFDTARELRRMADAAGKPFYWYVDGDTCSAGVALAASADRIIIPEEGRFGSIGIIAELWNHQGSAEAYGAKCVLVTSGKRKADGHPMAPITEETIAAIQASVNEEFEIFTSWISQRRGIVSTEIEGWEAAIFHGNKAVALGLADAVETYSGALAMLASVASGETPAGAQPKGSAMKVTRTHSGMSALMAGMNSGGTPTTGSRAESEDMGTIRESLGKKASEDSDEGRRARKALEALDAEEQDDKDKPASEEPDGDEGEGEDEGGDDAASATAEDEGSGDETKLAEDESKKAKKAEDEATAAESEAKKAEDEVDQALAHGDSKAALAARKRSKAARARKASALMRASVFRSNARVHQSLAKAAAKPAPSPKPKATTKDKLTSALGANAARGTRGETQTGPAAPGESDGTISLADVSREDRRAAGLDRSNSSGAVRRDHEGLTIDQGMSPAQAKELMGKLESEMARVSQ